MLRARPHERSRMTRGRCGSLLLHRVTLSFTTPRRFNPAHGGRPMDLNYAPEDREFRAATRRWLEANVAKEDHKTLGERKAWHRKLYEAGYVGMLWPREYGG